LSNFSIQFFFMFRSLILAVLLLSLAISAKAIIHLPLPQAKIITIRTIPNGTVYMDQDTLNSGTLAKTLQQRLWKSYTSTGKMYNSIHIIFDGEVLMGTRGAVLDAIKEGQQKALTELCLQKYKKEYTNLSDRQKSKLNKQYPVLFQELTW